MIVEVWTRNRQMGDEGENNMEDTSGPEKSAVQLAGLGLEDLVWVLFPTGSGLVPARSWMVNSLAHEILLSPSSS